MVVLIEDLTWSISVSTPHCRQDDEAKTEDLKHRLCTETEFPLKLYTNPKAATWAAMKLISFIKYISLSLHTWPIWGHWTHSTFQNWPWRPYHQIVKKISHMLQSRFLSTPCSLLPSWWPPAPWYAHMPALLAFSAMETFSTTFWYFSRPVIPHFGTYHTSQSFELSFYVFIKPFVSPWKLQFLHQLDDLPAQGP